MPSIVDDRWDSDVLVIGGGVAGALAALRASEAGLRVTLIDKGCVGHSGMSPWASEIADCSLAPEDVAGALARFSRDSEYLNDPLWTELHLRNAGRLHGELHSRGLLSSPIRHRPEMLLAQLRAAGVSILERVMVTAFLKDTTGRVAGVLGFHYDDTVTESRAVLASARAVVSCMGSGSLRGPGCPVWGLTHDGDALAYAAGARITGKEFIDLHPAFDSGAFVDTVATTAVRSPGDPFRAPGTLRGLMALETHFRAMQGDINTEDDTHSRAIVGDELPMGNVAAAMPGASLGLGVYKGEGAVSTTGTGAVDGVPGLYVAGDCLGSMMAGPLPAPAGTSYIASAVQGDIAGRNAAAEARLRAGSELDAVFLQACTESLWAPRERPEGYAPSWVMQCLQNTVMPFFVSYVRDERRLLAALANVSYLHDHCATRLIARDGHELRLAHEIKHMLLDQEMRLRAALLRRESRGSHFREDFPFRDDAQWLCWIDIHRGADAEMKLATRPVPAEWHPSGAAETRYPRRFPGEAERMVNDTEAGA